MMKRQSVSQRPSQARHWLALAAVLVALAALWWIWEEQETAPAHSPMQPPTAGAEHQPIPIQEPARVPRKLKPRVVERIAEEPPPAASPARVIHPDRSLAELERQFHASRNKQAQIDLLGEIAGHNDAAAVQALARIFPLARDAEVKESALARLADIDPQAAPEARIALLEAALRGQARNVRLTALGLLAESDNPRALAALRRAAREDSDQMVRDAAAAMAQTAEESGR